ncbi:MAG TPA: chemotaxis protein CheB [Variovorax sp.]|nr:chemotaxis protein CheB [Variovorax sp.]
MTDEWKLVVIASSSESIDDLHRVLQPLRAGIAAAIVLVVKEPASGPSLTFDRIARGLSLPVSTAVDRAPVEPGRVFLAPYKQRLTIDAEGCFRIDRDPATVDTQLADLLFASAAQVFGARVIGIVMSGRGRDGTAGLRAIHHAPGAIGIVQSPADAAVPGMTINAVLGDSPDYVPLVDDMGKLLVTLIHRPVVVKQSS